jgi:hypothetical protein
VGVNLRKKTLLKVSRELSLVVPWGVGGPQGKVLEAANLGG